MNKLDALLDAINCLKADAARLSARGDANFEAKPLTIDKQGNRFVVTGQIYTYSNGGKTFGPENYTRAFKTRAEAEQNAKKINAANIDGIRGYNEEREERTKRAANYLTERKSRSSNQGNLF